MKRASTSIALVLISSAAILQGCDDSSASGNSYSSTQPSGSSGYRRSSGSHSWFWGSSSGRSSSSDWHGSSGSSSSGSSSGSASHSTSRGGFGSSSHASSSHGSGGT